MTLIKVWWHCLMKTVANMKGEDHRMCTNIYYKERVGGEVVTKVHFCTCGYPINER